MSPIEKALSEIQFKIPREILELAFNTTWLGYSTRFQTSIESNIQSRVITNKVIVDCDLIGGIQVVIPLSGIKYEMVNNTESVILIPVNRLQGRNITSVFSIGYYEPRLATYAPEPSGNSGLVGAMSKVIDSHVPGYAECTSRIDLIGPNAILIKERQMNMDQMALRCTISNAAEMQNIKPRSTTQFAKLCVLATKAYIYNTLNIRIDKGVLHAGAELGVIRETISEYADAAELYDTYLTEVMGKVLFFNDSERKEKHVRRLLSF